MSTNQKSFVTMIDKFLTNNDMLVSTKDFLMKLRAALSEETEEDQEEVKIEDPDNNKIIVSCDASIKKNPGGPASVGVVIQRPGVPTLSFGHSSNATTNNQAEYDAIYSGLTTLVHLVNSTDLPVVIRSDSQLVIRHLRKETQCKDKKLLNKRDIILELVSQLPMNVSFEWLPRNSTQALELANFKAQDFLGVPRH